LIGFSFLSFSVSPFVGLYWSDGAHRIENWQNEMMERPWKNLDSKVMDVPCCAIGEEEVFVSYISHEIKRTVGTICMLILLGNKCGKVIQRIGGI